MQTVKIQTTDFALKGSLTVGIAFITGTCKLLSLNFKGFSFLVTRLSKIYGCDSNATFNRTNMAKNWS